VEYVKRLIYVENTYGVGFQRKLLEKLREDGLLSSNLDPGVERLPAGKCSKTLQRRVLAMVKTVMSSCSWGSLKDGD
jgi:uncharacterized protein YllA (UPF0747 family)